MFHLLILLILIIYCKNQENFDVIVNISGVDKLKLLRKIWDQQRMPDFYSANNIPEPCFDNEIAKKAIKRGYIDYLFGKFIDLNLKKDLVYPDSYNRNFGDDSFKKIVEELK